MRRSLWVLARNEAGAAAVEFALVITPFLLLLFGVIETGRLFWTNHALQEAAISGARCMGLRAPSCALDEVYNADMTEAVVQDTAAGWGIGVADTAITLEPETECREGDLTFSKVRIEHEYRSVLTALTGSLVTAEACFPNTQ